MGWVRGFEKTGFSVPSFLPVGRSAAVEQSWNVRNLHRLERFFIFSSNLDTHKAPSSQLPESSFRV